MAPSAKVLNNGSIFETVFKTNPRSGSAYKYKAARIDGKLALKVILSNDSRIIPGVACRVKVISIAKQAARHKGGIIVEAVEEQGRLGGDDFYVDPKLEIKILTLLEEGKNILLDGPQGSGKTTLSRTIAKALHMEYVFFTCSTVFETTEFLASLQLKSGANQQPETVWIKTDILRALENAKDHPEKHWLIFLDELNRMRDSARNGIMPALDSTRKLFNPITGTYLDIPPNVSWVAAINNGPQFTGANDIDPAQLDRFSPVKLDYPPAKEEISLLRKLRPTVSRSRVEKVVQTANAIRNDNNLGLDLSVRATEEAVILLANPRSRQLGEEAISEILKTSFCGRFPGSYDDDSTDAGLVWQLINKILTLPVDLAEVGFIDYE